MIKIQDEPAIEIENTKCDCKEILCVDDDAFNLLVLELILEKAGKKIIKAFNG